MVEKKHKSRDPEKEEFETPEGKATAVLKGPQVYAIGAIGHWTEYDFRIGFFADATKDEEKEEYLLQTQVILSPRATKELSEWLSQKVEEYEEENGIIETEPISENEKTNENE